MKGSTVTSCSMVTDSYETNCGDHSALYTKIKLLCCTPETNMLRAKTKKEYRH